MSRTREPASAASRAAVSKAAFVSASAYGHSGVRHRPMTGGAAKSPVGVAVKAKAGPPAEHAGKIGDVRHTARKQPHRVESIG